MTLQTFMLSLNWKPNLLCFRQNIRWYCDRDAEYLWTCRSCRISVGRYPNTPRASDYYPVRNDCKAWGVQMWTDVLTTVENCFAENISFWFFFAKKPLSTFMVSSEKTWKSFLCIAWIILSIRSGICLILSRRSSLVFTDVCIPAVLPVCFFPVFTCRNNTRIERLKRTLDKSLVVCSLAGQRSDERTTATRIFISGQWSSEAISSA